MRVTESINTCIATECKQQHVICGLATSFSSVLCDSLNLLKRLVLQQCTCGLDAVLVLWIQSEISTLSLRCCASAIQYARIVTACTLLVSRVAIWIWQHADSAVIAMEHIRMQRHVVPITTGYLACRSSHWKYYFQMRVCSAAASSVNAEVSTHLWSIIESCPTYLQKSFGNLI